MNILVDGPARSGKLLLGKLLLGSSQLKFQHYSGDIETLLESIYFNKSNKSTESALLEVFRNNLVHTLEDLRQFRQLSINSNDSSYYKNSILFDRFPDQILSGNVEGIIGENPQFVLHSHECVLFLNNIESNSKLSKYLSCNLQAIVSIIRNPAAQALSWLSRNYPKTWSKNNCDKSPSILYTPKYVLPSILKTDIKNVPWFINESLNYYLEKGSLQSSDLKVINIEELLVLSVCYLTRLYLDSTSRCCLNNKKTNTINRYHLFHEDLHDKNGKHVTAIFDDLGLEYSQQKFRNLVQKETNPTFFGRDSIQSSFDKLSNRLENSPVFHILQEANSYYNSMLNS